MSITYELIQLMNATIDVKSKKGEGTIVKMNFLIPVGDEEKIIKTNLNLLKTEHITLTILLVEDNEFNRMVAINTLKHFNCKVTEAVNGLEAVSIIKSGKKFDIILMDLQMPVMDGFECTQIMRKELQVTTPIIALTANAFKSELEQCIQIGMDDCVTKPFEEEKLMNAIYKLIDKNLLYKFPSEEKIEVNVQNLYNLDKLISLSGTDQEYLKKMISIFSEQAMLSISEIREAYNAKNLSLVYHVAHRIKPSLDLMGVDTLRDSIRFVEKNAKEANDSLELGNQINFLCDVINKVIDQLKQEK